VCAVPERSTHGRRERGVEWYRIYRRFAAVFAFSHFWPCSDFLDEGGMTFRRALHSLQPFLRRPCSHMPAPPHSLQKCRRRLCTHMPDLQVWVEDGQNDGRIRGRGGGGGLPPTVFTVALPPAVCADPSPAGARK
jgi:hypothetical protein